MQLQCYVPAWMRGEFGREWIHVCVWLSHTALLFGYTPVQNVFRVKKMQLNQHSFSKASWLVLSYKVSSG